MPIELLVSVVGVLAGLSTIAGGYVARSQRIGRHARDLVEAARRRIPRDEEGRRVVLVGRLRAAPEAQTRSFADGRPVAVSSLMQLDGRIAAVLATRIAHQLVLETDDGEVPVLGSIHLERTRAATRPDDDELAFLPEGIPVADTWVLDAEVGELVMVEGILGRITREGLREPSATLGIASASEDFGYVPIRMTALRLELPRWPRALALRAHGARSLT